MAFQSYFRTRPDGSHEYFGTARPTLSTDGPFQAGDILINVSSSAGGPYAWRCTAAGSPGTWEEVARSVRATVTKTSNYTVTADDEVLIGSTSGGAVQFTLPDATLVPGKRYTVKRIGASVVTVVTAGGLIDAGATATLAADKDSANFVSDGTKYIIESDFLGTITLAAGAVTESQIAASSGYGLNVLRVAHAKYSFATHGGTAGLITPAAALNSTIPDKAIILGGVINSTTAVTSGGAAEVAVGTSAGSAANSILTATAKATLSANAVINSVITQIAPRKMTAAGVITFTISTNNLTAGVIEVFVFYVVSET